MQTVADQIIDALGGSTAVSRMMDAPLSTVHSWRKNGVPRSRLAHLRLLASVEKPEVNIDVIVARGGCAADQQQAA
jgi:hypothetical protein